MKFLHKPFNAKTGQVIVVTFSKPTKVLLIESTEFEKYKRGKTYRYRGGFSKTSPVEFVVPHTGIWHAIIEKGSYYNPLNVTGNATLEPVRIDTLNGELQAETHGVYTEYDDTLE